MLQFKTYGPLKENGKVAHCHFRSIVFKDVYHIFEEDLIGGRWQIFKRTSIDGINLSERTGPLFPFGEPGSFDEWGKADPSVICDGPWRMWFDAMDASYHWDKIGYAVSPDGDKWIIVNPVLSRGTGWDNKSVHHPAVTRDNGINYLYYSGCKDGEMDNVRHIGLAISDNSSDYYKIPKPVIYADELKYVRPSAPVFFNGRWMMFYWGFDGITHGMYLAESSDLVVWEKKGLVAFGTDSHDGITGSQAIVNDKHIDIWYSTFDNGQIFKAEIYE